MPISLSPAPESSVLLVGNKCFLPCDRINCSQFLNPLRAKELILLIEVARYTHLKVYKSKHILNGRRIHSCSTTYLPFPSSQCLKSLLKKCQITSGCKPVVLNWKLKAFKPCLDTLFVPTIKSLQSLPLGSSEHIRLGIQKSWRNTGFTAKFHESQQKCSILSSAKQIYSTFKNGKSVTAKAWYMHGIYRSSKNLLLQPFHNEAK